MTHQPDFSGCWAKIDRANVHLDFLRERIKSFAEDMSSYDIRTEDDWQTAKVFIDGEPEPPVEVLGAIIGDVVHNLRSALDHLVWQLTIANGYTPPNPIPRRGQPGGEWRDISFPVYTADPRAQYPSGRRIPWRYRWPKWSRKKVAGSLWGVRPDLRTVIQKLQPFNRRKNPSKEPLAVLDELWNIDKHRHLHLALFSAALDDVGTLVTSVSQPELALRVVKKYTPRPLKGRTEIGSLEYIGEYRDPTPNVDVSLRVTFDVAFEQGPPAYGGGVIETLKRLHDTVAAIMIEFETKFP
jgi:hypothetical protein